MTKPPTPAMADAAQGEYTHNHPECDACTKLLDLIANAEAELSADPGECGNAPRTTRNVAYSKSGAAYCATCGYTEKGTAVITKYVNRLEAELSAARSEFHYESEGQKVTIAMEQAQRRFAVHIEEIKQLRQESAQQFNAGREYALRDARGIVRNYVPSGKYVRVGSDGDIANQIDQRIESLQKIDAALKSVSGSTQPDTDTRIR